MMGGGHGQMMVLPIIRPVCVLRFITEYNIGCVSKYISPCVIRGWSKSLLHFPVSNFCYSSFAFVGVIADMYL